METKDISQELENQLPEMIKEIATKYSVQQYIQNPDFLEERLSSWHQFGLITHTKMVRDIYVNKLEDLIKKWGLDKLIKEQLNKEIDNIKKELLLNISIIFHDLGKIICLEDNRINREHEVASVKLLEESFLNRRLERYTLSKNQIDYIKRVIGTHDVLGKELRDKLKEEGLLNIKFLENSEVSKICKEISSKYSDVKLEVGIFFLCDLLGKTEFWDYFQEDSITPNRKIDCILTEKNLPPQLKKAINQLPLNIKLAEIYLKNIFN